MGQTVSQRPWLEISQRSATPTALADGACAAAGQIWGCYLHGLFDNEILRRTWLASLGWRGADGPDGASPGAPGALDNLASHIEASLDMPRLQSIIWGKGVYACQ